MLDDVKNFEKLLELDNLGPFLFDHVEFAEFADLFLD